MTTIETRQLDAKIWPREKHEHYVEPHWCSERLFAEEQFEGTVWDPCCGFGRIVHSARMAGLKTLATDLVYRGCPEMGATMNFLACLDHQTAPNIVGNPPFNIAPQFATHALELGNTQKVAMIFPTARLNAAHWLRGTPLVRVWLMTPRPSMPPGHTITAGEKPGGGKMDFCWLVWERGYTGNPELRWLRRAA
jgi:hypothetical protein